MNKKLYRNEHQKVIGGVCAGLAEYFGMDVSIIRVIFALSIILKCIIVPVYIILWIVLPKKSLFGEPFVDYRVPPFNPIAPDFNASVPPFKPNPFIAPPVPKTHTGSMIVGMVLLLIGGFCLLEQFDWIPDWDFDHFWPIIPVAIGLVLIINGTKKHAWEKQNWHHNNLTNDYPEKENPSNENPTTV